jgi:hypothetical protein
MTERINDETYKEIRDGLVKGYKRYYEAMDLLQTAQQAGEETTEQSNALKNLKRKIDKWSAILEQKGYEVPKPEM